MSNSHFARTPNINIPRTKMKQSFTHKTAFEFGKLIPIDSFEVLPGDTFKLKLSSLIRMSTPIAPIMDNIECYLHAFFVPMRLVWKHTEEFFGANKETAGPQKTIYEIPHATINNSDDSSFIGSICDYLGKPYIGGNGKVSEDWYAANILKERAYYLIWSEWYRAQQIQDPFICNMDDADWSDCVGDVVGTIGGQSVYPVDTSDPLCVMPVCKKFDYFTAATISPQYGEAVLLPLGAEAPIKFTTENGLYQPVYPGSDVAGLTIRVTEEGSAADPTEWLTTSENDPAPLAIDPSRQLYADLSQATAATVNDIRYAFQVQKYLERSNFGSRFFEMLANHYGVTSPDARLQRPEYLGGHKFMINVNQVLSTAGADASSNQKLGQTGAVSVTGDVCNLFTKGFVEPGYVMIMLSTKQDHTYAQGILREDLKRNRFEIYSPEFANLGDQEIKGAEIFATGDPANDNRVFGYQEHWAEYRYRPNRVSSILNPNGQNSLDFWTLADKFASAPTLSPQFIEENRENIARALVTGAGGPDFIADLYFDYTAVRPMPAYTIPGLIDHFGAM